MCWHRIIAAAISLTPLKLGVVAGPGREGTALVAGGLCWRWGTQIEIQVYAEMSPHVGSNLVDVVAPNEDLLQMQLGELCLGWRALFGCSYLLAPSCCFGCCLQNLKLPRQSFFSSNEGKLASRMK